MRHFQRLLHPPHRALHRLALATSLLLTAAFLLAGCGGTSTPSAASILQSGQQKYSATPSFHFLLTTQHPGAAPNATTFYPIGAEGDVVLPDRFQANVTIALGVLNVTTQVVAIGDSAWVNNPATGRYEPNTEIAGFAKIFNPQTGISSLLTQIDSPSQPVDRSLGGTHCWSIRGTIAADKVASLLGTPASSSTPLAVSVCVGKDDHQMYLVSLTGPLFPGDTAQTEHDFTLSKFSESISVTPPPGV
ncbi:MAG: LppX_LprAFG lipoprotein [Ktedonobacterales bacterium]|nr:LppX_LprAFG lipoprotein [Ktedonobacterales bacterium]